MRNERAAFVDLRVKSKTQCVKNVADVPLEIHHSYYCIYCKRSVLD